MKSSTVIVVVVIGAGALYLYSKRSGTLPAGAGFSSLGNVGGVAHSPDITTGGVVSVLGTALPSLTKWFGGGSSNPNVISADQWTPSPGNPTVSNPVYAAPAVLPYSYKQQNIDTAANLNTDSVFTPSPITGSSGTYSDAAVNDGSGDILNNGFGT